MSGEKNEKLSYLMMAKEAIQTEKSRNGTSKQVSGQQFSGLGNFCPSLTTGVTEYKLYVMGLIRIN